MPLLMRCRVGAALSPAAASQRFGQQQGAGGHSAALLPPRRHSSHEVSPLLAPPGLATHPSSWHKLNETTQQRENGESVSSHTIIWLPLKAKGQRAFFPGEPLAEQSRSVVAGRFVCVRSSREERRSRGEEAGAERARWEEGKEPASGGEICRGFATFPSNPRPREPLATSPLYQRSCMRCTSLAGVWLALFWV